MADARVQALLHPARQRGIGQHQLRGPFNVVHVDPATFSLEGSKLGQQQPGQARHALVVVPGVLLGSSSGHLQGRVLGLANDANARELVWKFACGAFVSQQRLQHRSTVTLGQGLFKCHAHC